MWGERDFAEEPPAIHSPATEIKKKKNRTFRKGFSPFVDFSTPVRFLTPLCLVRIFEIGLNLRRIEIVSFCEILKESDETDDKNVYFSSLIALKDCEIVFFFSLL